MTEDRGRGVEDRGQRTEDRISCSVLFPQVRRLSPAVRSLPAVVCRLFFDIRNLLPVLCPLSSVLFFFLYPLSSIPAAQNIAATLGPSVVRLEAKTAKPIEAGGKIRRIEETGSGVIIALDGKTFVLTNHHIVANVGPESVRIFLADRRALKPLRILISADFDVALLEIEADNLVPAKIGDSDAVEITDRIFAFGSPFGLSGTVSSGIISAKGRRKIPQGEQAVPIQDFFQIDASINRGNSGGPLVNAEGEVIGIVTAIASGSGGSEGVAFAIPINRMLKTAKQLAATGKVIRPYLGVELDPKFGLEQAEEAGLDREIGTRVEKVAPNSPGSKAEILAGDIIVSFNGAVVEDDLHLVLLVARSDIGDQPELGILRNGTKRTVRVRLTER